MIKLRTMETIFGLVNWFLYLQATIQASHLRQNPDYQNFYHSHHRYNYSNLIELSERELNDTIIFAERITDKLKRLETTLSWSDIHVKLGTPSHGQLIESHPEEKALQQSRSALISIKAATHLTHSYCFKHNMNMKDCIEHISLNNLYSTPLSSSCPRKVCTQEEVDSKYRSLDGSCNNVINSLYGMSFTGYRRLISPEYFDGIQEIRRSVDTKYILPSPRLISTTFNKQRDRKGDITLAFMQWTQFIEHDISSTAISKSVYDKKSIECCRQDGTSLSPRYVHPSCANIPIPINDAFYSKHSITCMPYVRSIGALELDCKLRPLNQLNQATHFLDGSQIYGSHESKSNRLREFHSGLLHYSTKNSKKFLPRSSDSTVNCQYDNEGSACYVAGDSRVNMQPLLTIMHTLWMREHNRIAKELKILNPKWSDEKLFQESRRLVIALLQQITYNEYLPALLGENYLEDIYDLNTYSESIDPRISNSFATAAFKFATSLIDDQIGLYDKGQKLQKTLNLADYFNKPYIIEEPGNFDKLIRCLSLQKAQLPDMNFVKAVSNKLFQNGNYGLDSFSLNIQRGRDHGIPSYVQFRKYFGFSEINSFSKLEDVMPKTKIDQLKAVYRNVNDIDLIVGGLAETPENQSLLGPTLSRIILEQMKRLKLGDRFFFDNEKSPYKFTEEQLHEIKKATLARVFCDNGDEIEHIQPQVFKPISQNNLLVSCWSRDIPYIDLNLWSEED